MQKQYCAACGAVPASVFCSAEAAYLCAVCDFAVHEANKMSRSHTRVPVSLMAKQPEPPAALVQRHDRQDKSSSQQTLDESDVSSGFLVVPDMDDIDAFQSYSNDITRNTPQKVTPREDSSWDPVPSWVPVVPEHEQERLASIAGAFVKKEAQTLLQSTSRGQSIDSEVTGGLDVSWMEDAPPTVPVKSLQSSPDKLHTTSVWGNNEVVASSRFTLPDDFGSPATSQEFSNCLSVGEDNSIRVEEMGSGFQTATTSLGAFERSDEQKRQDREAALKRFRNKRANRSFRKKVRYECRKQLADSRPRVKGRFVGRSKLSPQPGIQKSGTTVSSN